MTKKSTTRRSAILSISMTTAGVLVGGCTQQRPPSTNPPSEPPTPDLHPPVEECVETGAQTAGPFYPGEPETMKDISGDRTGVPLQIEFRVVDVDQDCADVANAEVDLWHADANGDYSGYEDFQTEGEDWLRGQQLTDEHGTARFRSIFPGSYPGRSVHVHVKVRAEGFDELTTQVYFPDDLVASILSKSNYNGAAHTLLEDDNFFSSETLSQVSDGENGGVFAEIVLGLA
jgi:protocatechuate 3,4-dioxygenase beta subunit